MPDIFRVPPLLGGQVICTYWSMRETELIFSESCSTIAKPHITQLKKKNEMHVHSFVVKLSLMLIFGACGRKRLRDIQRLSSFNMSVPGPIRHVMGASIYVANAPGWQLQSSHYNSSKHRRCTRTLRSSQQMIITLGGSAQQATIIK
jgi:hypothetical protein